MKRVFVLGIIVTAGLTAAALSAQQQTGREGGQGRGAGRGGGFGGVGMIQKVAENVYMIPGAGGNTGVFVASNGVVLVDTKLANNGQAILDQVRTVSDKPVTHIINTHSHPDHNGSNQFFPPAVEIVAHENAKKMAEGQPAFKEAGAAHGIPDRAYRDRLTLLSGSDTIELYYYGAAHTNGDSFVVFRNARVMHAGDVFAGKGQPFIDRAAGGSGIAYGETIDKASKGIRNIDRVITGHSTVMTWQDFVDFGEFNRLMLTHARQSLKAGKTPEQAMMDFKLPEKFTGYTLTGGRGGAAGNFGTLYEELKQAN